MEGVSQSKTQSSRSTPSRNARGARSRARVAGEAPKRPTRAARRVGTAREGVGIDDLYLAEMAESSVLTAAQELEIGERIASAERSILDALFTSPAGTRALGRLADDLDAGRASARDLILNPDQADLDIKATTELLRRALDVARSDDEAARMAGASDIAKVRLDDDVLAALIASVREAPSNGEERRRGARPSRPRRPRDDRPSRGGDRAGEGTARDGQPSPRRALRAKVSRAWGRAAGPRAGRESRAPPRGRQVQSPARLPLQHVRSVVDQAVAPACFARSDGAPARARRRRPATHREAARCVRRTTRARAHGRGDLGAGEPRAGARREHPHASPAAVEPRHPRGRRR